MRNKRLKIVALIALVLGVATLSIGFAVFSKTLNIGSTSITTTPRTNPLETAIHYDQNTAVTTSNVNNVTNINTGTLGTDTWSNVSFTIDSNQTTASVRLIATIVNDGNYTGYLKSITSNGAVIQCTPVGDTDPSLVQTACSKINVSMNFSNGSLGISTNNLTSAAPINQALSTPEVTITNSVPNTATYMFNYYNDGVLPDGQFTVTIPAMTFDYSSVSASGN